MFDRSYNPMYRPQPPRYQAMNPTFSFRGGGRVSQYESRKDTSSLYESVNSSYRSRDMQPYTAYRPSGQQTTVQQISGNTTTLEQTYQKQEATSSHGGIYSSRQPSYPAQFSGEAHTVGNVAYESEEIQDGALLSEEIIEHKVTVPVRRCWEETVMEKQVIEVPTTVLKERVDQETKIVREKVQKIAQTRYNEIKQEVIVPIIEEVPEEQIQDVYVDNYKFVDEEVQVTEPRYVPQVVEMEVVKYVDETVTREVPVPVYVDDVQVVTQKIVHEVPAAPIIKEIEIPEYKKVEVLETVNRNVPVGVEHIVHQKYELPQLENEYEEVPYTIYVAQFKEIAIPAEYLTDESILECENLRQQVQKLTANAMPPLCVLEDVMERVRRFKPENVTDPEIIRQRLARQISQFQRSNSGPDLAGSQIPPHMSAGMRMGSSAYESQRKSSVPTRTSSFPATSPLEA